MKIHIAILLTVLSTISFSARSAASNCPAQIEITQYGKNLPNPREASHPTYYLLPNGKVGLRNYPNDPMMEWGPLEEAAKLYSSPEMGEEYRPVAAWARCHLAARKGGAVSTNAGASSTKTEQIANCPPTLPPSCVTWSLYDQQLQWWNLTNNCGRDVSVTFRSEGGLENTQTFGSGESYRGKWRGTNQPQQIVWDAAKGSRFYGDKPAGAELRCRASLPL